MEIDEALYEKLREKALSEGFINVEDYIIELIQRTLETKEAVPPLDELIEKLKPRIKRIVEDSVNEFMKQLVDLKNKVGEIYEKIEVLETEINNLKQQQYRQQQQQPVQPVRRRRKTGIEILHEQKILYESKLERLRDRDRFFEYLKRQGAVVLELEGERVAIDPEFWREFTSRLAEISTPDPLEVRNYLSPIEYELFRKLRDSQLVYFDSKSRQWRITGV